MYVLMFLIVLFLIAGGLGGLFVNSSMTNWYIFIKKPFFTPPGFVFAPVWTILYILLAIYYYRLDNIYKETKNPVIKKLKGLFILQLVLNYMWTPVFFGLHSISGGLILLLILDFLVGKITLQTFKIDKKCFYISLVYLLWLLFATSLNLSTFILN